MAAPSTGSRRISSAARARVVVGRERCGASPNVVSAILYLIDTVSVTCARISIVPASIGVSTPRQPCAARIIAIGCGRRSRLRRVVDAHHAVDGAAGAGGERIGPRAGVIDGEPQRLAFGSRPILQVEANAGRRSGAGLHDRVEQSRRRARRHRAGSRRRCARRTRAAPGGRS